jgi:LacI family transcriptional regulator
MQRKLSTKRVTQKEVARLAEVSQTTVSLILANSTTQTFSGETLERVFGAARKLGYTPNRLAQALKTHRTMTLACVIPDIENPFYPALVSGVQAAAEAGDYDVIVLNTHYDDERERRVLQWGMQGRVDGIIGVFFALRANDFKPLVGNGVGVLRIEASSKRGGKLPIDSLFVDNFAAATAATRYLQERGHTRISMITGVGGPQNTRVSGYEHAMREVGLTPDVVVHSGFDENSGVHSTRELLSRGELPTAIQAANDLMAIGAISALRAAGKRIPDDVAVMGFDDISAARLLTPTLSTVNQFQHLLGQVAGHMMLQRLNELPENAPGRSREMPFEIVQRGSA